MLTKRLRLLVSQALLGAVLLAQAAYVVAACGWMERAPARAVQNAAVSDVPPCHEPAASPAEGPLCLSHCMQGFQSLDKPQVAVASVAAAPVYLVLTQPAFRASVQAVPAPLAGPPPRIRFQSLQI
jgi:hypothetical protein